MDKLEFDYIVVGGGSSGSVLASRLSEDPKTSVCLIEAGTSGNGILSRLPLGNIFQVPEFPGFNNWKYKTVPQAHLNNRIGYQPCGRALGGSSTINGMIYMRGHPDDYDQWAREVCGDWSWKDVLPYFLKSENNQTKQDRYHGSDGMLHVSDSVTSQGADDIFLEAAQECGFPLNTDFNGPDNLGCGRFQLTQFHDIKRRGTRCSAAAAFIAPNLEKANLNIISGMIVDRLEMENGRINSVIAWDGNRRIEISSRAEIILCAGSFGTPAILMRSGIGPADELKALGIKPIVNKQDVGKNLQDHLQCALHYQVDDNRFMGLNPAGMFDLLKAIMEWRKHGRGLGATSFTESGAFLKSNDAVEKADLQIHFFGGLVEDHGRKLHFKRGFSAHVCVLHPESKGTVCLRSAAPSTSPLIDPNYLSTDIDAERLITGVKKLHRILEASAFSNIAANPLQKIDINNDDAVLAYIKDTADTAYHPVGTCRMGSDEHAIVNPQLRLRGVENLRIADASIIPTIISGNTNAACIMIGERAADFIKSYH